MQEQEEKQANIEASLFDCSTLFNQPILSQTRCGRCVICILRADSFSATLDAKEVARRIHGQAGAINGFCSLKRQMLLNQNPGRAVACLPTQTVYGRDG
ncbi:MAG: hypothetical protein K0Q56_75 [Sporolactobacillus laevolacticus]|nr:hypothetical protein [Sporolactobacillus laevolacticus]